MRLVESRVRGIRSRGAPTTVGWMRSAAAELLQVACRRCGKTLLVARSSERFSPARERRATPRAEIERKRCLECGYLESKRVSSNRS